MTQKELSNIVEVSRQTINAIEGDKCPPTLEVAFRITHVFGTSIEDVFFYEPGTEGEHEFADGLVVEVSRDGDDDSGGN